MNQTPANQDTYTLEVGTCTCANCGKRLAYEVVDEPIWDLDDLYCPPITKAVALTASLRSLAAAANAKGTLHR